MTSETKVSAFLIQQTLGDFGIMKVGLWCLKCWKNFSKKIFATFWSLYWHFTVKIPQIWQQNQIYTTFFLLPNLRHFYNKMPIWRPQYGKTKFLKKFSSFLDPKDSFLLAHNVLICFRLKLPLICETMSLKIPKH